MNRSKGKILKTIIIASVIVLFIGIFIVYMASDFIFARGFIFFATRDVQQRQIRLLCKTDHQALLEACRELSKQVAKGELKAGKYNVYRNPDPEVSQFPKPILTLEPSYVYIDENDCGRVMVEMFGGFCHFGVKAYTEEYNKPSWAEYGDKELIKGLWYYDDGYIDNPGYEKNIQALIKKEMKTSSKH